MKIKEWGIFVALSAIWGSSFLFIKLVGEELTPFTLVSGRLGLALAGLVVIVLVMRLPVPRDAGTVVRAVLMGLTNAAIPFVLITWGETRIDSGMASVLNATTPLFSLVIAHFFLEDERFTAMKMAGLLTGFGGVALIFSASFGRSVPGLTPLQVLAGQGAVVLASICYGASAVYIRRSLRGVHPIIMAALQAGGGFIFVAVGALIFEQPIDLRMSGGAFFGLAWLGLLGTCLAYIMMFNLLQWWGATRTTLVTYLIPVLALALGVLVRNEPVDWRLFVGFGLIISGIVLVSRRAAAPAKVESAPEAVD